MKTIDYIPTSKIERAAKILQTGAKVGVNYLKFYVDKVTTSAEQAKDNLDESNAEDIYNGLKQLKGSALKAAQMMSMDKSILPRAFVEKFSLAQFSVPPLSPPLVEKTFKKYFGKGPNEMYDTFDFNAVNAASIGQVHKATLNGKSLAVKIQYPGVAQSISSDLSLIKPAALRMLNMKASESEIYFKEVESKLLEETDYLKEIQQSDFIVKSCQHLLNLKFPRYYQELSNQKVITMDWMEGLHLSEFVKVNHDKNLSNILSQALWDFYMFQIHQLKQFHADPHPGNFLISTDHQLIAIDFGCIKSIPQEFYNPFFDLAQKENIDNPAVFREKLIELEILFPQDKPEDVEYFTSLFHELLSLFTRPFHKETFDFSDESFFEEITLLGQKYAKSNELKKMNAARGSRHFIYMNRTFFGLYNLMFDLKGEKVVINNYKKYI